MTISIDITTLERIELFDNLTTDDLLGLLPACEELVVTAGQVIYEVGHEERALYVLLDGTAEVDLEPPRAGERVLSELTPGSVFGESSFFHAAPHSATVKARTDARLLRLNRQPFDDLLQTGNPAALRLAANAAKILAARLQAADRFIVDLLEQIQDEKIRAAVTRFRNSLSHSFSSTVRPSMQIGSMNP
jgi:CRP/FNR family transcriptional regulator, cyclic AMP receptor protein